MANFITADLVFNRITGEVVHDVALKFKPDTEEPDLPDEWLINPDLTPVIGIPEKYWKINDEGTGLASMDTVDRAAVDEAELAKLKALKIQKQVSKTEQLTSTFPYGGKEFKLKLTVEELVAVVVLALADPELFQPIEWTAEDGTVVDLDTQAKVLGFCQAAALTFIDHKTKERNLNQQARAATDALELKAVKDNRGEDE